VVARRCRLGERHLNLVSDVNHTPRAGVLRCERVR
jgi:hypothetical protein